MEESVYLNLPELIEKYVLYHNYPNPFNPQTKIQYYLSHPGDLYITVYNIYGQEVVKLKSGYSDAGLYSVTWEGKDSNNNYLSSGVYICCMKYNSKMENTIQYRKMILAR